MKTLLFDLETNRLVLWMTLVISIAFVIATWISSFYSLQIEKAKVEVVKSQCCPAPCRNQIASPSPCGHR